MKYAIVTGGTEGMGKAIAERFLHEGFSVAVCARDKNKLMAVEAEWNERFPTSSIITFPADMSIKEDVVAFADRVISNFPQIDVLVNNAGTYLPGTIAYEPDGRLETLMGVNLFSAYHMTREVLPTMKTNGKGHIFNICSVASLKAYKNGGSYSISKYALVGFSDNLREELADQGIKVTSLCPGATYTRSWHESGVAAERMLEADDVAKMVWAAFDLSAQANVDTIVMRPVKGDL